MHKINFQSIEDKPYDQQFPSDSGSQTRQKSVTEIAHALNRALSQKSNNYLKNQVLKYSRPGSSRNSYAEKDSNNYNTTGISNTEYPRYNAEEYIDNNDAIYTEHQDNNTEADAWDAEPTAEDWAAHYLGESKKILLSILNVNSESIEIFKFSLFKEANSLKLLHTIISKVNSEINTLKNNQDKLKNELTIMPNFGNNTPGDAYLFSVKENKDKEERIKINEDRKKNLVSSTKKIISEGISKEELISHLNILNPGERNQEIAESLLNLDMQTEPLKSTTNTIKPPLGQEISHVNTSSTSNSTQSKTKKKTTIVIPPTQLLNEEDFYSPIAFKPGFMHIELLNFLLANNTGTFVGIEELIAHLKNSRDLKYFKKSIQNNPNKDNLINIYSAIFNKHTFSRTAKLKLNGFYIEELKTIFNIKKSSAGKDEEFKNKIILCFKAEKKFRKIKEGESFDTFIKITYPPDNSLQKINFTFSKLRKIIQKTISHEEALNIDLKDISKFTEAIYLKKTQLMSVIEESINSFFINLKNNSSRENITSSFTKTIDELARDTEICESVKSYIQHSEFMKLASSGNDKIQIQEISVSNDQIKNTVLDCFAKMINRLN